MINDEWKMMNDRSLQSPRPYWAANLRLNVWRDKQYLVIVNYHTGYWSQHFQ